MRDVSSPTEFQSLLQQIDRDGMVVRKVIVEAEDVVFLKSVIEAYPGVAAVHAERGQGLVERDGLVRPRQLILATTSGFESELDGLLEDLQGELSLIIAGSPEPPLADDRVSV
jgi:hypothetical protein